jgi:hypothetical protein
MPLLAHVLSPTSGHASAAYVAGAMARIEPLWENSAIGLARL